MGNIMAMNIAMQTAMTNEQKNILPELKTDKTSPLKKIFVLAALTFLACFVVIIQLGEAAIYNKQWQSALALPFSKGEAAANLSTSALAAEENDTAKILAAQALNSSLTHVEALRTQGIIRFNEGETDAGKRLIELAGKLSWRDSVTHAWLFERSLIDGNYTQSIEHADALLRRRRANENIFNIFNLAATEPQLVPFVVEKLEKNPPWRVNYFAQADQIPAELYKGFDNIIYGLNNSDSPIKKSELIPYVNMLAKDGNMPRALKTWANIFPLDSVVIPKNGLLVLKWPNSSEIEKPSPASWRLQNSQSIYASVYDAAEGESSTLALELNRTAIGQIAERKLIIPAGKITLHMTGNDADKNEFDKLRWYLKCDNKNNEIPLQPSPESEYWTVNIDGACDVYSIVLALKLGGLSTATTISLADIRINHSSN